MTFSGQNCWKDGNIFFHVLQRTWWTRAWNVQEFANPTDATFLIGDFSINWNLIAALIIVFYGGVAESRVSDGFVLPGIDNITLSAAIDLVYTRLLRQTEKSTENPSILKPSLAQIGFTFMILLRGQSGRKCSDPRDKIYSILSITDTNFSKALLPNYSIPARDTYIAVVRTYINISKSWTYWDATQGNRG
jgi:hypothetical protein